MNVIERVEADFRSVRQSSFREVRALTGLRGVAATNVMIDHVTDFIGERNPYYRAWLGWGGQSVHFFFVLSAFTLCLVYAAGTDRELNIRNYAIARFARIYPLAIAGVLWIGFYFHEWQGIATPEARETLLVWLRQLLLINHWPLIGTGEEWIAALWSLSVEVFCYVFIFPVLFLLSMRASKLGVAALLSAAFLLVTGIHFFSWHATKQLEIIGQVTQESLCFISGWIVYLIYLNHREHWQWLAKCTDTVAVVILTAIAVRGFDWPFNYSDLVPYCACLIVGGLLYQGSRTAMILSSRPIHFLGIISYSLYVWHIPVKFVVERYYANILHRERDVPFAIVVLVLSLVVATISYYAYERPVRDLIRKLFGLRRPAVELQHAGA
jgi:peptidoglycan/LPS O-acetylase OafA/YrhL